MDTKNFRGVSEEVVSTCQAVPLRKIAWEWLVER